MTEDAKAAESPGYRIAKEKLPEIQERYDDLLDACESYLGELRAELARVEGDTSLPPAYAARLGSHVTTGEELLQVLETLAHDALVRASDRAVLIQIAYEGRFV
ncbi:MAG: hypothetical protein IT307_15930 [Chloroflexi bacterium]|nr:hypothetical protein [Chloroflexota bacterium]